MVPLVSVILPVYNQERYLTDTIESVLNQTFTNFELLIMDDGSTDQSNEIIKEYKKKDERVKTFYQSNAGRCVATNRLVEMANGEYCALLDADDIMLPNRLEAQIKFHLENKEVDASSSFTNYINSNGRMLGTQFFPGLKTAQDSKNAMKDNVLVHCAITGLVITKQVFLKSGGLKSEFWPCDDFEFSNRLVEQGFILVIIQEALMKYRIHPSAISAQNPLHMYDKIGYVMDCIKRRRAGIREMTFEEFSTIRKNETFFKRMHRRRFNYSQIFFRNAGISMMSKQYPRFIGQIIAASILSPSHVFFKIKNLRKRVDK